MAELLKSKSVVDSMSKNLSARSLALRSSGIIPTLALVRVGEKPSDMSYERTAIKRAESLGIATKRYQLEEFCPQAALEATIAQINADPDIHGCLMFRPLPSFLDEKRACDLLAPQKDIDGISTASLASIFTDFGEGFPPCTAKACIAMLDHYNISIAGKHVVVIGRSLVVGKPVSMMLLARNASATICHSRTENLFAITRTADIVICATGRARAFGPAYFTPGQVVLDVGINFDVEGKLCGDVDFEAVEPMVSAITPVPGGIGSVTTSITMEHTILAAEKTAEQDKTSA